MKTPEVDLQIAMDRRLTAALETLPGVVVPEDFAVRVMASLPPRTPYRLPSSLSAVSLGRRVSFAAAFILFAAMLGLSLATKHLATGPWGLVEGSFAAEFILLTVWLSLRPSLVR